MKNAYSMKTIAASYLAMKTYAGVVAHVFVSARLTPLILNETRATTKKDLNFFIMPVNVLIVVYAKIPVPLTLSIFKINLYNQWCLKKIQSIYLRKAPIIKKRNLLPNEFYQGMVVDNTGHLIAWLIPFLIFKIQTLFVQDHFANISVHPPIKSVRVSVLAQHYTPASTSLA